MTDETIAFKDQVKLVLRDADTGKIKIEINTKRKVGKLTILLAGILLIPAVIYYVGKAIIKRLKHLRS